MLFSVGESLQQPTLVMIVHCGPEAHVLCGTVQAASARWGSASGDGQPLC